MIKLSINGQDHEVDVAPDTPLLWVIRDTLGMTGTRFGCGMGLCGACTMHMGGNAVRTCILPVSAAAGMPLTTIEGLDNHVVQDAWLETAHGGGAFCGGPRGPRTHGRPDWRGHHQHLPVRHL